MLSFNSNGTNNISGKLIKTVMRSVINQDRMNDFLILSSEKDSSDSIDLEQIVCRWAKLPKTKRIINAVSHWASFIFDLD